MIRQRMVEARPKLMDDKFGGDDTVNYQNFKMRFQSVTEVGGANPLDVINELTHWLRGAPLKLANAHIGSKDPRKAIREIWGQLDLYYAAQIQTAAERIKPLLTKGSINKDDIDGLIELMSELLAIKTQLKGEGMEGDLDRQDIIRDILNKKLPFMSEEFYKAEIKRQRKDSKFRMRFDDMLQAISEKVCTMKAQGFSSKKDECQPAKIQSLDGNEKNNAWKRKAESPPKQQQQQPTWSQETTVECFYCNASHPLDKCNALLNLSLMERIEILKMAGVCFKCLKKAGHIARSCDDNGFKCNDCHFNHPTILCGQWQLMQKQFKGNSEMSDGCNSSNQTTNDDSKGKNTSHASPNLHVSGELNNTLNKSSSADNLPLIPNVNTA